MIASFDSGFDPSAGALGWISLREGYAPVLSEFLKN